MIVEQLIFQVTPKEFAKDFLQVDNLVWTPWLKRQDGFVNKTSTYDSEGKVTLLITWRSRKVLDALKSKEPVMKVIENLMKTSCPGSYNLVSSAVTET
jgi:uncharacterized protein (TIGR03792 family)